MENIQFRWRKGRQKNCLQGDKERTESSGNRKTKVTITVRKHPSGTDRNKFRGEPCSYCNLSTAFAS